MGYGIVKRATKFLGAVTFQGGVDLTTATGITLPEVYKTTDADANISAGVIKLLLGKFKWVSLAVNYFEFTPSATGNAIVLAAKGTDTDIDLTLDGKGAGKINVDKLNVTDTLNFDGVSQSLTATIALAAGATNSINATITMKDAAGVTVTGAQVVEVFITESATGALGLTANSASGSLTASTGVVLTALTAKKHIKAVTDVNGVLVLNLVDSAKPATQYFAVVRPFSNLVVSAASGTSWGA